MEIDLLIIDNYIPNVKCVSFYDSESSKIRVRPLPGQGLPTYLMIECCRKERKSHPIGTVFIAENVKVCQKENGTKYLRAKDQKITRL